MLDKTTQAWRDKPIRAMHDDTELKTTWIEFV
jgi:hypothetical protein